jgi:hypothetical protein
MSLQMQLRRGVIALVIGLALCAFAAERSHEASGTAVRGVGSVIRAVDRQPVCSESLRIDFRSDFRVTVNCDGACAPMNRLLGVLHVSATPKTRCAIQTA